MLLFFTNQEKQTLIKMLFGKKISSLFSPAEETTSDKKCSFLF
jgi:hypothetical protein